MHSIKTSKYVASDKTLILGATQEGSSIINNSGVVLHNCVLWEGDLGNSDCEKLAYWPWKNLKFDVVGTSRYEIGNGSTAIDLISSEMFDKGIQYYYMTDFFKFDSANPPKHDSVAELDGGITKISFLQSRLCTWLNE
jgi:hypothetical protein